MSAAESYFAQPVKMPCLDEDISPGWLHWRDIDWPGGLLYVGEGDLSYGNVPSEGCRIDLAPGLWRLEVLPADFQCSRDVCELRLRRPDAVPEVDGVWGEMHTDICMGAMFAVPVPELSDEQLEEIYYEAIDRNLHGGVCYFADGPGPPMHLFGTGSSDGIWPVQRLSDGGFFIQFLSDTEEEEEE